MSLGETIRIARQKAFYNQSEFAKRLNVAVCTVNRWEQNKVRPNVKAMKEIKVFCDNNGLDYTEIERVWLAQSLNKEKKNG